MQLLGILTGLVTVQVIFSKCHKNSYCIILMCLLPCKAKNIYASIILQAQATKAGL